MKINKKISLKQILPLSEVEIQGLLYKAQDNFGIFMCDFSLSSCPEHGLKLLLLLNPTTLFKVCTQL
jgi:hypothetical protein